MNILVTGGGGYLGSVLVPMLLEADQRYSVTVVDTFSHGIDSLAAVCHDHRLKIVRADARLMSRDLGMYANHVEGADIVIPLAALVGTKACDADPTTAHQLNAQQINNLVDRMLPQQALIYPCTNSGYGLGGEALCTELSPLQPLSKYGRTKVAGEGFALRHPNAVSLRFATLFGCAPRMRLDLLVNDLVFRAVRDGHISLFEGHFRRNFLHVHDAAKAILWVLTSLLWTPGSNMKRQIYNVGDSQANMTKAELCVNIKEHVHGFTWTDVEGTKDPDQRDYVVSNAKFEATGWRPERTLDEGIDALMRAYIGMPFTNPGYRN